MPLWALVDISKSVAMPGLRWQIRKGAMFHLYLAVRSYGQHGKFKCFGMYHIRVAKKAHGAACVDSWKQIWLEVQKTKQCLLSGAHALKNNGWSLSQN